MCVLIDRTCAQKHDGVVPIISRDAVDGNLRESVLGVNPGEDGTARDWVHRVVHERVHTDKADDIVREIFCGPYVLVIRLTRALFEIKIK